MLERRAAVAVILARPENPENIGLVARAMKNTGFADLRLAGLPRLSPRARKTAVHAEEILGRARCFPDVASAAADCGFVFAATAKPRAQFPCLPMAEAVASMRRFPPAVRLGLLFGNERTGLLTDELLHANAVFTIPQAGRQPSYNLAAAVLLTLFALYAAEMPPSPVVGERPIPRREQEATIRLILEKLAAKGFIHGRNRRHVTVMIHELFGRLAMTDKDRRLLLAVFTKGVEAATIPDKGANDVRP